MINFSNHSEYEFIYHESAGTLLDAISNLTCFYLLSRKRIRIVSSMRYLSVLTIVDSICLYGWFLSSIYRQLNDESHIKRLENFSALSCKIIAYMSFTSLQLSSFLLCIITIDRLLIIISPFWRSKCTHIKLANCIIVGSLIFFFLLNLIIPINLGNNGLIKVKVYKEIKSQDNSIFSEFGDLIASAKMQKKNTQSTIVTMWQCYNDDDKLLKTWNVLHLCLYSLLPFPVLGILNLIVINLTRDAARHASEYNKQKVKYGQKFVTRLLMFLTISFICTTLPSTVAYAFWHHEILEKKYGRVLLNLLNTIQFSRHGFNWIIYLYSSSFLRIEFKRCISCASLEYDLAEEALARRPTQALEIMRQLENHQNRLSSTEYDQLDLYFLYCMYEKEKLRVIDENIDDTNLELTKNENNLSLN
ncbi:FMRFamide receptor-like [Brachionus plicatilis]|uniref:FMRFamide receptor-like n=1 Tax=Brachionus plicatilis TaxID=10195 RepID=A0A3M7RP65_BRAPC|nr:FMRFamide receptor-like [Brachionus plicatilis]